MTKDELIISVIKSCKGDELSKRLVSDIVDATFENIGKSIKKDKRFSYPSFGTFTVSQKNTKLSLFLPETFSVVFLISKLTT